MRILSLLPSATEIVYALGLEDELAAVTHECDFPPAAARKPVITSSVLTHEKRDSLQIHKGITGLLHEGRSIYHLDEKLLAEINPDLILTQELCDVCAVSYDIVQRAARILQGEREIISLEPGRLDDILENIRLVAEKTDRIEQAEKLLGDYRRRIDHVVCRTAQLSELPRVYCMEWLEPPFAAGHWIPEMVAMAGGQEQLGAQGQPSQQVTWQQVLNCAPEILILMPCGFDLPRTLQEARRLPEYPGWAELPAVRTGRVYAVDGSSYFNRPGPRIVDGLEILAQIIQPQLFSFEFPESVFKKIL